MEYRGERDAPSGRATALLGGALFALAWLLYASMAAPGLDWGDAGEAQLAAWRAGLSHPTGYPLFLMVGWIWSHTLALLGLAPTRAMTLFSVTAGAAAVGMCVPMMVALLRRGEGDGAGNGRPVSGTSLRLSGGALLSVAGAAAMAVGLTPTFWSQALRAEVYTLHALFIVALLWLLWRPGLAGRLPWVALLLGFALGHHRTMIFWIPGLGWWLWRELGRELTGRRLIGLAVLVALPLLVYLYVPLRGPVTDYLHQEVRPGLELDLYDGSVRAFLTHILGTAFAGDLSAEAARGEQLALARRLARDNSAAGLFFALALFAPLALRARDLVLLIAGGTLTLAFALPFAVGDAEVQFIPVWIVVTFLAFAGVAGLAARLGRVARPLRLVTSGAALLLPLLLLPARPESRAGLAAPRALVERVLVETVPESAILIGNDRDEAVPLWYAQYAEGRRQDLLALFPLVTPRDEHRSLDALVGWALEQGRPVLLVKEMPGLAARFDLEPVGDGLARVVGVAVPPTSPVLEADLAPALEVSGIAPDALALEPESEVIVEIGLVPREETLPPGLTFSLQLFDAAGERVAQREIPPDPIYSPAMWPDGGPVRLAAAVDIPPLAPGSYQWRLSAYTFENEQLNPFGRQVVLGEARVGE